MALDLHNTENPIANVERLKINENWQRIIAGYNHLEWQIKILTGKEDVGELIKRLEDALNDSEVTLEDLQLALSEAQQSITDMIEATTNANVATSAANQATNIAVQIITDLTLLKGDLEQLQTSLEQSITDASQATTGAINATTNANQAAQDAQQATTSATDAANRANDAAYAIEGWGQAVPYESGTIYNRNNFVTHEGSTYQAKHDGVTSIPTTTTDWILIARRGLDGQGAVQTVNDQLPDQNGNVDVGIANINGLQGALDAKANDADLTSLENVVTTHLDNEALHLKAGERSKWDSVANRYPVYCQTITDWNNAVTNGLYMGSNVANAPSGDWFMGEVIAHDANYIEQRISSFASTQLKFVRRKIGGTWSHWMRDGLQMLRHYVIRDAALTGNLVLPHSTGKIPAAINIQTHINGSKKASWGWWDGSQYCMYTNGDSGVFYIGTASITMENASGHYTTGYVDWVNREAIGISFTHGGNGATGSMNISIQLFFGEGR